MITAATQRMPRSDAASAGAEVAIARRAFTQVWRGACLCAVVFGSTVAASALSYAEPFAPRPRATTLRPRQAPTPVWRFSSVRSPQ